MQGSMIIKRNYTKFKIANRKYVLQSAVHYEMLYSKRAQAMSKKSAAITVRINADKKEEAEAILAQLGLPSSIVIDALYHQIILRGEIPSEMLQSNLGIKNTGAMGKEEFDALLQKGYDEALEGDSIGVRDAFKEIRRMCKR